MKRPSILYLHCHDAGRFIEPYGYPFRTPRLLELAHRGTTFRNAFAASPTCSPSRAALLTGRYPHSSGMYGLASSWSGFALDDYSKHLASFLRTRGYATALAGVQHVAREPWASPLALGYDNLLNHTSEGLHDPRTTTAKAIEFISGKPRRPFFLSVGYLEPHRFNGGDRNTFTSSIPQEPEDLDSRYRMPLPGYPDRPESRREAANFAQGLSVLDGELGAVLAGLARAGLQDETIVLCTTDHGPGMPGMKSTLSDAGTGVFLIMAGPDIPQGGIVDGMVHHTDLFPTLCELLGFDTPPGLAGVSAMPLVRGEVDHIHDEIYGEQTYHDAYRPLRSIRTVRYKLIRRFGPELPETSYSADAGGPMDRLWKESGWEDTATPEFQLYDLLFDPQEKHNLAYDPSHAMRLADLNGRLERWMHETGDRLGRERILPPAAADERWEEYWTDRLP